MRLLASESDVPEAAIGSHDSVAATCFETSIEVLCIEGWSSTNCHAALLRHGICSPEHPEYRSLSTKNLEISNRASEHLCRGVISVPGPKRAGCRNFSDQATDNT